MGKSSTNSTIDKPKDGYRRLDDQCWSQLEETSDEDEDGDTEKVAEVQIASNLSRSHRISNSASVFQLFIGILIAGCGWLACMVFQTAKHHGAFCSLNMKTQMYVSLSTGLSTLITGMIGLAINSFCGEGLNTNRCVRILYSVSSVITLLGITLLMAVDGLNLWMYYRKFQNKYSPKTGRIWEEFSMKSQTWSRQLAYQIVMSVLAAVSALISLTALCCFCCHRRKRTNLGLLEAGDSSENPNPKRRRQNRRDRNPDKALLHEE